MDAFEELRKLALSKRDAAIKAARDECRSTLTAISRLKAGITGVPEQVAYDKRLCGPRRRPIIDILCQVMPSSADFTARQITDLVQADEPARSIRADCI